MVSSYITPRPAHSQFDIVGLKQRTEFYYTDLSFKNEADFIQCNYQGFRGGGGAVGGCGGVCPGQSLVVGAKLWCDVELGVTRTVFTKSVMVWF